MCKEMLVKLVNRVVDKKKNNLKKWRAEEEERHKGSLTQKKQEFPLSYGLSTGSTFCYREPWTRRKFEG
jgi:hypothetical protein